jgi:ssRNA-specific RNase YbeY (16S rRNA maturation enzyme)
VVASDLRNFVKSKQDLYIILTIEGQLHLPPYDDCTMEFLRDALSGRKKLLTNRDLCPVNVPRYKEFNALNLQALALQDDELRVYLPDASDSKTINRRFLFNVSDSSFHTADHQHGQARLLLAGDL